MNVLETVLVFGGIPLAGVLVLTVAVYGKTLVSQQARYRPGRPWTYEPVWYLPHPTGAVGHRPAHAVTALPAAVAIAGEAERMGGASGEW